MKRLQLRDKSMTALAPLQERWLDTRQFDLKRNCQTSTKVPIKQQPTNHCTFFKSWRPITSRQNWYFTPTPPQVVETSVTNNSLSKDYSHPDDHTTNSYDKCCTCVLFQVVFYSYALNVQPETLAVISVWSTWVMLISGRIQPPPPYKFSRSWTPFALYDSCFSQKIKH